MKHISSWTDDEKRTFVHAYHQAAGDQKAVGALCRRHGIAPKNVARDVGRWIDKLGIKFPKKEQTALSLPSPAPASEHDNVSKQQRVFTQELKSRLLERYFGGNLRELQKHELLAEHGLTAAELHSWRVGTKWAGNGAGPMVNEETVGKRRRTRDMPYEKRLEMGRRYLALERGPRGEYARESGVSLGTLLRWGEQARRVDAGGRPLGRPPGRKNGHELERQTEEVDLSEPQQESKRARKASYDQLLEQNLILKGLLNMAESQGFDMKSILKFGR